MITKGTAQRGIIRESASAGDPFLAEALGYMPTPETQETRIALSDRIDKLIQRAGELIGCHADYRNIACIEVALDRLEKLESLNKILAERISVQSELLSKAAERL